MKIEMESFSPTLLSEIIPLGQKCWDESTKEKGEKCAYYGERDYQIEPNAQAYQRLADGGALVLMTLRDEGKLVGYVSGFTYQCLHHQRILGAVGDTIYIEPEYRAYTAVIVEKFENEMRERGVNIVGWPTQEGGAVYNILKTRGYVGDDIVMEKRLCA